MVASTNHAISWPDLHCTGPWHFVDYRTIFLPNIGEDQKKSYYLSAEPLLALPHMVNLALVIALLFKKGKMRPEVATFKTKTLKFTRVIHLNWLAKLNWGDPGPPAVNIIVNYCVTLYVCTVAREAAKRNWRKKFFLSYFYHWWHFD